MTLHLDAVDTTILGPALLTGLLVLLTHVPLGAQVLARGIVFIDLAIAQIAGLGVILADALGYAEADPGIGAAGWAGLLGVQAAAMGAALAGAALLAWTEKRAGEQQEALIGVLFILAACAGLLVLAGNPHGGEHLKDLLVGQILWVQPRQIALLAGVTVLLLLALWRGWTQRGWGFYAAFALAVTASVQLVGVYLVFSSLIIPALATRRLTGRARLAVAYGLGAAGYALGLLASALLDLPSGAVIVWALAVLALATALLLPRQAVARAQPTG